MAKTSQSKQKKEIFPKIAATAKITQIISKPACVDLKFDGFTFTARQCEKLIEIQQADEAVRVTIQVTQGQLPM